MVFDDLTREHPPRRPLIGARASARRAPALGAESTAAEAGFEAHDVEADPQVGAVDRSNESQVGQEAAVIGVVIAGVLVSFTIPGPFDWGSSLIGLLLLGVLLAYGRAPRDPTDWRRALGGAVALAFCLMLVAGRPLDQIVVGETPRRTYFLSGWTAETVRVAPQPIGETDRRVRPRREDEDRPVRSAGWPLLALWSGLVLVLMGLWRLWAVKQARAWERKAARYREAQHAAGQG